MKYINDFSVALPLFKCLGSGIRLSILELLYKNGPMPMQDIARELNITCGSLSPHIKMLSDNNMITIRFIPGKHGQQRICTLCDEPLVIAFDNTAFTQNTYESFVGVGHYSDYQVYPTCGLATAEHLIGSVDDPKYFASPERFNAGILWLTKGYVEYIVPNFLTEDQIPTEMLFAFEISSEAPGFREDWPSDIDFSINGQRLCTWTAPGDFGQNPGIFTPAWWHRSWNQHGMLNFLSINDTGTFFNGVKKSTVSLNDLNILPGSTIRFRICAPEKGKNQGGLTLYGKNFGNFDQDILVRMHYRTLEHHN